MTRFITCLLFCSVIFSSCRHFGGERVRGNGNIKKESRTAGNFTNVEVSNAISLYVTQDSTRSITIEADENLVEYVIVESDNELLHIRTEDGFNLDPSNGDKVKVYVSAPVFKRLQASGACSIIGQNQLSSDGQLDIDLSGASDATLDIKMPKLTAGLSGASNVTLKGETKDFSIDGSGACEARCFDLSAENVDVDVSGASNAEVFASVKINPSASGASEVRYKGKAVVGSSHESGASSVKKVN